MLRIPVAVCLAIIFNHVLTVEYTKYPVINLFQKYVQIDTTSNTDFSPAVDFWKSLASRENVSFSVTEFIKGYPVVVMKWTGTDPSLSSVMLNSHMDVVPANNEDGWKYPPFSAHIDNDGDIYGRGTQDMKSLAIQQFEALRRIKNKGESLLRNVYMTVMPDEETGSANGMSQFIKSKQFADMNVGVELDEGWSLPAPDTVSVLVQDKAVWQFRVDCYGNATHSSLMTPTRTTASAKCIKVAEKLNEFRDEQLEKANKSIFTSPESYTSVNLVMLNGGTALNVIPGHVRFTFDLRLGTQVDERQFLLQLNKWIKNAGENVTLTFLQKGNQTPATIANDSNPYWKALVSAARVNKINLDPIISTGATDAKYLRGRGVPAFGLSPMMNTPLRFHKVNERLNVAEFLRGAKMYEDIVKNIANVPSSQVSGDPSVYVTGK